MLTSQQGFSGRDYSGEHVSGEALTVSGTTASVTVLHTPIKPGTVTLSDPTNVEKVIHDIPNADGQTGKFEDGGTGIGNGTVNYVTGEIKMTDAVSVSAIEAEFDYDQNSFDARVDEIDVRVVSEPVVARPRKLKSVYMFDRFAA